MIRKPPVELRFLSLRGRRDSIVLRKVVPERLHQFELFLDTELAGLFEKRVHE